MKWISEHKEFSVLIVGTIIVLIACIIQMPPITLNFSFDKTLTGLEVGPDSELQQVELKLEGEYHYSFYLQEFRMHRWVTGDLTLSTEKKEPILLDFGLGYEDNAMNGLLHHTTVKLVRDTRVAHQNVIGATTCNKGFKEIVIYIKGGDTLADPNTPIKAGTVIAAPAKTLEDVERLKQKLPDYEEDLQMTDGIDW